MNYSIIKMTTDILEHSNLKPFKCNSRIRNYIETLVPMKMIHQRFRNSRMMSYNLKEDEIHNYVIT